MTALTAKQESFIAMMKRNDELAIKGFHFLLQRDDFVHFFGPLEAAGFFSPEANPAPVPGERENTVRVPYWPPLSYLKAAAEYAGAQNDIPLAANVMKVIRTVSGWRDDRGEPRRNYHTSRTFAEILGLLPTSSITLTDVELIREWLNDPYERMLIAVAVDKGALPRLLNSPSPEDWEKAAKVLYAVTAIGWTKDDGTSEPTPYSLADDYFLGVLLKNHAKQIGTKAGEPAVHAMLKRVREVFSTDLRRDHSSAFRPAVEDDAQNHQWRSVENCVVDGLRDVLLGWIEHNHDAARTMVQHMLADNLQIIRRIGIYILAQHWMLLSDLFSTVVGPTLFTSGQDHELYHLLQDRFAEMNAEQKATTVAAIDALPNPGYGDDPERLRRRSQYRWLSAITGKGYAPADRQFANLGADPTVGGLSDHPDFDAYITSSFGPGPTPYSPEELTALAKTQQLVEKLNGFVPRRDWEGPTTDGLTSALEVATRNNPEVFLDTLSQYLPARRIHQHALIIGLKQAWEAKSSVNWERGWDQLIRFFEQLFNENFRQHLDDSYHQWVMMAVADFLHAGTQKDEHAYDSSLLPRAQKILARLLEWGPGATTPDADAMTQALNTTKGRIVEALFGHALRGARLGDRQRGDHQNAWDAVRPLFETELTKCKDANYEFSTLCGAYLPQLQYLDASWTSRWIGQIFPVAYEANTVCALDGVAYASFTRPIYEVLAENGIIDRALVLNLKGRNARERILERIAGAYLWGIEALDGQRFTRIFNNAATKDLEVLTRVFWTVRSNNVAPDQQERILSFWDRTVTWLREQPEVPAHLLSALSLLATYITTIGARERRLLEAVAPQVHVGHETYEFAEQLVRLAPQDPAAITKTLQLMLSIRVPDYDYEGRIRALLEFLANNGQRDAVILLSDRLRHLDGIQQLFRSLTRS